MNDLLAPDDKKNPKLVQAAADFQDAGGLEKLTEDLINLSTEIEEFDPDDLRDFPDEEPTLDCRLRYHEGNWSLLAGDASYDQDHNGHWGSGGVGANLDRSTALFIARTLVDEVLDSIVEAESCSKPILPASKAAEEWLKAVGIVWEAKETLKEAIAALEAKAIEADEADKAEGA